MAASQQGGEEIFHQYPHRHYFSGIFSREPSGGTKSDGVSSAFPVPEEAASAVAASFTGLVGEARGRSMGSSTSIVENHFHAVEGECAAQVVLAAVGAAAARTDGGACGEADIHHQSMYWLSAVQSGHVVVPLLPGGVHELQLPLASAVYSEGPELASLLAAGTAFVSNTLHIEPARVMPVLAAAVGCLVHSPPCQEEAVQAVVAEASGPAG